LAEVEAPVSTFLAVTEALGSTAPLVSFTEPTSVPVSTCAHPVIAALMKQRQTIRNVIAFTGFISLRARSYEASWLIFVYRLLSFV
jgi:hypothetical protein